MPNLAEACPIPETTTAYPQQLLGHHVLCPQQQLLLGQQQSAGRGSQVCVCSGLLLGVRMCCWYMMVLVLSCIQVDRVGMPASCCCCRFTPEVGVRKQPFQRQPQV
jgi:hypothetical protein